MRLGAGGGGYKAVRVQVILLHLLKSDGRGGGGGRGYKAVRIQVILLHLLKSDGRRGGGGIKRLEFR